MKELPLDLNPDGLQIFLLMSKSFEAANNIREAPLADVIWGFAHGGYSPGMIMGGIQDLYQSGYIALTDDACTVLDISSVRDTTKVWYMLTDKWINILAGPGEVGKFPSVHFDVVRIS